MPGLTCSVLLYEHIAQYIHYFKKFNRKKPTNNFECFYLPILWTTQSCWQRGQRLFCFTHKDMQQLWKEWLHSPQTTEREERTCSSHTQLCDQHLQEGPNYCSQMFMKTASLWEKWVITELFTETGLLRPFWWLSVLCHQSFY